MSNDCKNYKKTKAYIEKNRALMLENNVKLRGKFDYTTEELLSQFSNKPAVQRQKQEEIKDPTLFIITMFSIIIWLIFILMMVNL